MRMRRSEDDRRERVGRGAHLNVPKYSYANPFLG